MNKPLHALNTVCVHNWPSSSQHLGGRIVFKISSVSFFVSVIVDDTCLALLSPCTNCKGKLDKDIFNEILHSVSITYGVTCSFPVGVLHYQDRVVISDQGLNVVDILLRHDVLFWLFNYDLKYFCIWFEKDNFIRHIRGVFPWLLGILFL